MAIDIAGVGPGIGMKLTLSSLFGKKLSNSSPLCSEAFPAAQARRLVERFEWHDTPKHGSWLDMSESEATLRTPTHYLVSTGPLPGLVKEPGGPGGRDVRPACW